MPVDLARLEALFSEALKLSSPAERASYLDRACGRDPELRGRVERLLASHEAAGSFMAPPAAEASATVDPLPLPERPGTQIGRYKLLEQIGEGGMGAVFMAEQEEPVRRRVALKIIKPGMDSRQVIARFEAERQALAVMDHPNIARVLDAGTSERGQPYFVMELVKGVPITRYCDERRLTPRERLEIFIPVCQAVQHAHQKGIIHRDLKPTNVLVADFDERPVVKVIDFGVAKAVGAQLTEKTLFTQFGQVVGTIDYMSPEQAKLNQLDIDTRSDIYSLGALLYELLTGSVPFDRNRLRKAAFDEVLRIIREEEPPKPSTRLSTTAELPSIAASRGLEPKALSGVVKGELDWIVMKALEKDRNRRYETASALARDVENHLNDEPVQACPPSALYRLRKFAKRKRTALAVAALALSFLIILGGAAGWAVRDRRARETEIEQDHVRRRAALEESVSSALAEVVSWHRREKWTEAMAAVKRAESLLASGEGAPELKSRVAQWRADLETIGRLEEIRLSYGNTPRESNWDYRPAAFADYEREFRSLGIDLDLLPVEDAASRIRARPIRDQLIAALDDWTLLGKSPGIGNSNKPREWWRRPLSVARAVDVDEFRNRVRLAVEMGDPKTREELARSPAAVDAWASTLVLLDYFIEKRELRIELLEKAQRAHPDDFFLNLRLAFLELEPRQKQGYLLIDGTKLVPRNSQVNHQGLPYAMAAVALRPENTWAWTVLGNALDHSGRIEEAIAAEQKAIRLKPDFFVSYLAIGNRLREQGKLDEAEATYRKAIEVHPDFAMAYSSLGSLLSERGKLDEAVAACRKAVKLQPGGSYAHSNLAHVLREQGRIDESVAAHRRVVELDPDDAVGYANLGSILRVKGNYADAVDACRKAIELQPDLPLGHHNLGIMLADQGKLDEAVTALRRAIELDPDYASAYSNLGFALRKQKKLDEAVAACRKAIALDPKCAHGYTILGSALADQRKYDEAIAAHRKAIDLQPNGPDNHLAYHNLGNSLDAQGKPDDAIAAYRKAIELKPDFAEAYRNLSATLGVQGKLDESVAAGRKAVELQPDSAGAYLNLGASLADQGKVDEAVAAWRKATQLQPDLAEAHSNLGAILVKQGKLEEAVAACRKAIELQPDDASSYDNLGLALGTQRKFEEAVAAHRKAIELEPGSAPAHLNLGAALAGQGKLDDAIAAYRKALELKPNDADAYGHLASTMVAQGKLDEAVAAYRKATELEPKNPGGYNDLAWLLATSADAKLRNPVEAVELAGKAVELEPQNGGSWNTLGVARYRAGKWQAAVQALEKSMELGGGGNAIDWFFKACAHHQLGERAEARKWYDRAVEWMEKNQPEDPELLRFRAEAAGLLGVSPATRR